MQGCKVTLTLAWCASSSWRGTIRVTDFEMRVYSWYNGQTGLLKMEEENLGAFSSCFQQHSQPDSMRTFPLFIEFLGCFLFNLSPPLSGPTLLMSGLSSKELMWSLLQLCALLIGTVLDSMCHRGRTYILILFLTFHFTSKEIRDFILFFLILDVRL